MGVPGPPNVEKLRDKRDIEGLIAALGCEEDRNLALAAAEALGEIADQRAVEPLVAALEGEDLSLSSTLPPTR